MKPKIVEKKTSEKKMGDLLFGAHSILEMLKAKKRSILSLYTTKTPPKIWERVIANLGKAKPNIQYVDRAVLDRIAGSIDHNGIVAFVTQFKYKSAMFKPEKHPMILFLDSIHDVRNLGAILRSAYCLGITGIVLCKTQSAPLCAAAFKASAGLAEYLDIYLASTPKQAAQLIKQAGYHMYMAVLNGEDATMVTYEKPLCLVIGNEACGIGTDLQKFGKAITLPQISTDISYNASVAAGILMFTIASKLAILPK